MIRKDAWNDLNFFELTKARFMAQEVIYPGECSMCTSEKGEIHSFGMKCPIVQTTVSFDNLLEELMELTRSCCTHGYIVLWGKDSD